MSDPAPPTSPKPAKPHYLWFGFGQFGGFAGTVFLIKRMPINRGREHPTIIDAFLISVVFALILIGILYVAWFIIRFIWKNTSLYGEKKYWLSAGALTFPLWFAGLYATQDFALNNPEPWDALFMFWFGVYLLSPAIVLALSVILGRRANQQP